MKRAIRYLRFSQMGQSNGSIERQELYTDQWLQYNKVEMVDTFIDRVKSARTFDRPDFIKLREFILKHHRSVDYLLVDQLDRFSRDAGEAMTMVKQFQSKYNIQIVSVTEGITFDYNTPGSFFRAGLQLLLAEEDNINRSIKVRGGIYTAMAKEGRFIYGYTPFGYKKEGIRKERKLVVDPKKAEIVRFIFNSYLRGVPLYLIKEKARTLGFNVKGSMAVENILSNPVYAGYLEVKPFKDHPGGLFPALHEPIVSYTTWQLVQQKRQNKRVYKKVIDDDLPLRGVLKCHCGQPLTGAPSRGKSGKYFFYYKCKFSKHNNISAIKCHNQLQDAFHMMSIPSSWISEIRSQCKQALKDEIQGSIKRASNLKRTLRETETKLYSLEEKWIGNLITKESYERWFSNYSQEILRLKGQIEEASVNEIQAYKIMDRNLGLLSDMGFVFSNASTIQKQELIKLLFDENLYYENGIYRTPTFLEIFAHNHLKMRDKGLLIYKKKEEFREEIPLSREEGIRTLDTVTRTFPG